MREQSEKLQINIIQENTVPLTYLANLMKLILLVSVLKGSERIAAARLCCASGGEVVTNLSFRRELHVAKHWLEWTVPCTATMGSGAWGLCHYRGP